MNRLAAAAEQAGAADDRRRDAIEHQRAAVQIGRHRPQPRGVDQPRYAAHESRDHEHPDADALDGNAGPPRGFGVAADRVDIGAERGPRKQNAPDHHEAEHDQDHPRHSLNRPEPAAIDVADRHHDDAGEDHPRTFQDRHTERKGDVAAPPSTQLGHDHVDDDYGDDEGH